MGTSGAMMAASYGSQAIASIGGAYAQSQAMRAQGAYKSMVGATNARWAGIQADDAIRRGDRAASRQETQTGQLIGKQRAAVGASGVDVNSGSAADLQSSARELGALDALTIRSNAWREAFGYKEQVLNATAEGEFAKSSADYSANNTLLTGGMQALGYGMRAMGSYRGGGIGRTFSATEDY